jgi:hypothetical protein
MNLRTMREMKYEYTQLSNLSADYINDKDAIEAIYARVHEEKQQQARAKQRKDANYSGNNLFLTGLGGSLHREGALKETIEKLMNEDFKTIANTPKDEVLGAIRTIYEDGRKDFHEVVNLLDTLGMGDKRRINIARLCKIYQGDIPTVDLRHIFGFDFFL